MYVCGVCGEAARKLYDGKCPQCLALEAVEEETKKQAEEYNITELASPSSFKGMDFMEIVRTIPRPEKRTLTPIEKNTIEKTNAVPVRVLRSDDFINIIYKGDNTSMHNGTLELSKVDAEHFQLKGNNVWYINRLLVSEAIRKMGAATRMMEALAEILKRDKMTVICEVNPYGDMSLEDLKKLYRKYGFKDSPSGYLLYTP